jgi:hypothetical protein
VKIIVASPAKTGNVWMKNLLAAAYGVEVQKGPPGRQLDSLGTYLASGTFKSGVFHRHYRPIKLFFRLLEGQDIHLVSTIRHPYDVFISQYFYVQRFSELFKPGSQLHFMIDKPIDHPKIMAYLGQEAQGFGSRIKLARSWVDSGRSIIVRFEAMVREPVETLSAVTDQIESVALERIEAAVEQSKAERMRQRSKQMARHVRKGTSGDWRNHLSEQHLEVINRNFGADIRAIGYETWDSPDK